MQLHLNFIKMHTMRIKIHTDTVFPLFPVICTQLYGNSNSRLLEPLSISLEGSSYRESTVC